ncbi:MAG: tRNA 2-thiouridine(34) synthase MnmA [Patescibacteria group bacterium]|nr:tRNA 2-thiouridine(34) synthase MnmA [Patescibacteria group bacterium]
MKVAVGLSGGVDSALSAALLVEQGFAVTGVFMECWRETGCRTDEDRKDALGVALKLKIPFKVLDYKKEYGQKVLAWFYQEYKKGRTPNPDIVCNQEIKFGLFLRWAMKNGFDRMATGHYARLKVVNHSLAAIDNSAAPAAADYLYTRCVDSSSPSSTHLRKLAAKKVNSFHLLQSVDEKKDQTYFLAMLKQEQLNRVLFPIGHLTKKQVRLEAKKRGLAVWNKKDSTGICFVGHDLSFEKFLRREIVVHEGEIVDKKGVMVGKHKGVEFYTIGQRHGFNTNTKIKTQNAKPFYVIEKDLQKNRLIVGRKKDLARKKFEVEGWHKIFNFQFSIFKNLKCRIRHQGRLIPCKIIGEKVFLKQAEYGVAPGQAAVIYNKNECLGGGVIK